MVNTVLQYEESFFEEEERLGYKISKKRKELWAVELDILNELERVCKKYNIKYFLGAGSLLGAVRDGHFIPWDDDVDVIMERKDYNELLLHIDEFSESFFFQSPETDKNYFRGHCQIRKNGTCYMLKNEADIVDFNQGIFIDVFAIDGLPNGEDKIKKFYKKKQVLYKMISVIIYRKKEKLLWRKVARDIAAFVIQLILGPVPRMSKIYDKMCSQYTNGADMFDLVSFHKMFEWILYFRKEDFVSTKYIPFENIFVPIPEDYDTVLRRYYGGEYMVPRKYDSLHQHMGVIIDTRKSYKQVLKEIRDGIYREEAL